MKILLTICLLLVSVITFSETYFVSTSGNDNNTGLSDAQAWQTLTKVNAFMFSAGDKILFKSGGSWFGTLFPKSGTSGNPITYGAYDIGEKPLLHQSILKNSTSDWTEESTNVWTTTATSEDVGNVIFNNTTSVGVKKFTKEEIVSQGMYWHDSNTLYLYSVGNPASVYSEIRLCLFQYIINMNYVSHSTIDGLALKYTGAYGIHGGYCNNLIFRNCDVAWIGGGSANPNSREGNGFDFYYTVHDILVENNRVWEIFDSGMSNQYQPTTGTMDQYNITYRNNVIWNCEWSFEYFNRSITGSTHDIYFINNTCYNAGGSWGHNQRTSPSGYHLRLAGTPANTTNFVIKNNIFSIADSAFQYNYDASGKYDIDYNCIYQPTGKFAILYFVPYANFTVYKAAGGYDAHSINSNPLLTNISALKFSLTSNSPCIDAGIDVGLPHIGIAPDLGYLEYLSNRYSMSTNKKPVVFHKMILRN